MFKFLLTLFLSFPLFFCDDPVTYTVDAAKGADTEDCINTPAQNSCKSIAYIFSQNIKTNIIINVLDGTYPVDKEGMTVEGLKDVVLKADANAAIITSTDSQKIGWTFVSPSNLTISGFQFTTSCTAVSITDGSTISLEGLTFSWGDLKQWLNTVTMENCKDVTIKSVTINDVKLPAELSGIPYVFCIADSSNIEVDTVTETATTTDLGVFCFAGCSKMTLTNLDIYALASNKLRIADSDDVTVSKMHVYLNKPAPLSSRANGESAAADQKSILSHLNSELKRRTRFVSSSVSTGSAHSNSQKFRVSSAGVTSVLHMDGGSKLTVSDSDVTGIHTSALFVSKVSEVHLSNISLSNNVHAFTHCVLPAATSNAPSSNIVTGSSPASDLTVIGDGVCVTLRDVSSTIEIKDVTFTQNQVTYTTSRLTQLERSYLSLQKTILSNSIPQKSIVGAQGRASSLNLLQVIADLFIEGTSADAKITMSGLKFDTDHMSFDEDLLATPEDHFIVPGQATKAPTDFNMKHVLSSRSSACIFVGHCKGSLSVDDATFTSVNGTAIALIDVAQATLTKLNLNTLFTQVNVFGESAIYAMHTPSFAASLQSAGPHLSIADSTIDTVEPSALSPKLRNSDPDGDMGFVFPTVYSSKSGPNCFTPVVGGILSVDGVPGVSVKNTNMTKCKSAGNGGCISIRGSVDVTVDSSNFDNSQALYGDGGCIALTDSALKTLTLSGLTVKTCTACSRGGAFYLPVVSDGHDISIKLTGITVDECKAAEGGALFFGSRADNVIVGPKFSCSMELSDVTVNQCTALYGAGLYLGSVRHVSYTSLSKVTVDKCTSSLSGAAVYFSAALFVPHYHGPASMRFNAEANPEESRYGLHMEDCKFTHNAAGAIGGGVFMNAFPVTPASLAEAADSDSTTQFSPIYDKPVDSDAVVPSVFAEKCLFQENTCQGGKEDGKPTGLHGGGAFTQIFHGAAVSQIGCGCKADSEISFNTLIQECNFTKNTGGAYAALGNVVAYLSKNNFDTNGATDYDADESMLLNIECSQSELNITLDNTFTNNDDKITRAVSYLCDSTCSSYSEFAPNGKKCASPKSHNPVNENKDVDNLKADSYPTLPQLSYLIATLSVSKGRVVVSTANNLRLDDWSSDTFDQVSALNSFRQQNGLPLLSLVPHVDTRFGNTSFTVKENSAKSSSFLNNLFAAIFTPFTANADAPFQVFKATAEDTGKTISDDTLTAPLHEAKVTTEGDSVTLDKNKFPAEAPDQLYVYVTADGTYWTDAITLSYIHPVSTEDRKKWGYISLAVMLGMILIFFCIVGVLQLCLTFVKRKCANKSPDYEPL